jgi:hypothetical protein
MSTPSTSSLLAMANVQMAAEAIELTSGMSSSDLEAALTEGNKRSSIFVAPECLGRYAHEPKALR